MTNQQFDSRTYVEDTIKQENTVKKNAAVCIHAHFYQPPRENPFTGVLPEEKNAAPYHDFNRKILAECYRPNAILGNFEHISFNVGATLLNWLAAADPVTYRRIVKQDADAYTRNGVGNAIAQPYFHVILPLATRREKETQIDWGIQDFVRHFGRFPQGMWLPETAVDHETLEILASRSIRFTILAPWQAKGQRPDTTQPYDVLLSDGKKIAVFFYQEELSRGVSFHDPLTENAHAFVSDHLLKSYSGTGDELLLIASDGELYGHHKKFRDWFLAYLIHSACKTHDVRVTTPGLWLQNHPPQKHIRIRENTSWSCQHGVQRWMADCACTPGNGDWKKALRNALNRLAQFADEQMTSALSPFGIDAWTFRKDYYRVVSGGMTFERLLGEFALERLKTGEVSRLKYLMQAQFERLRMFTSCAWFFDHFDRIEARNAIGYAGHAVWLLQKATGMDYSQDLERDLSFVRRDDIQITGASIYRQFIEENENRNKSS